MEKDAYRRRFDTSDAIIVPMVQKGKVEETILESIPQLVIQLVNTGMLGQLQSMPRLTIFSISLSVISLTNTVWYYSYWNLFRCMAIRDVPSTLSLYNYKLSGVKDGAFSFAKASSEIVEIELSEIEKMTSVTVSGTILNDYDAGDEQSGQLPPKNAMVDMSAAQRTETSDASVQNAPVGQSPGARGLMLGDVESDAKKLRLHRENVQNAPAGLSPGGRGLMLGAVESDAEILRLHRENYEKEAKIITTLLEIKKENEASILALREEKQQMEAEINRMHLELQRLPSVALDSAGAFTQAAVHNTHAAAAAGSVVDSNGSCTSPRVTRAAITLQSVTRGRIGRLLFQARCSQVAQHLMSEPQ